MYSEQSWFQKIRFFSSLSSLYILAIVSSWLIIHPPKLPSQADSLLASRSPASQAKAPIALLITGKPVRIVIPDSGVDLPVADGSYNPADKSWTLGDFRAQFAVSSALANNLAGNTFIYGHNNNHVFGPLRHNTPAKGAKALIYTDNGHIFSYKFENSASLDPTDTSALRYRGPPIMTIQTCTGSVNEWRTIFKYNFVKVEQ